MEGIKRLTTQEFSRFTCKILLNMPETKQDYDLVVIGAGPHGLIAAHTWLELYQTSRVAILESEEEVGCGFPSFPNPQVTANAI
jgi:ribulose 1,5-bisphosphate synthetase/thiazole synthase